MPDAASYHTDGLRAVMVFDRRTVALSEIQFFDWERLVDHYRRHVATSEKAIASSAERFCAQQKVS